MEETESPGGEMSFLEHLDELRTRLVRSAIAIAITFMLGWTFAGYIFNFLSIPVTEALQRAKIAQQVSVEAGPAVDLSTIPAGAELQYTFPADVRVGCAAVRAGTTIAVRMEQLPDGRPALVVGRTWGVGRCVIAEGTPIPAELVSMATSSEAGDKLVIETVQGTFNLYVKVSFYAAVVFSMPYLLLQLWGFIAPGLYPHERGQVVPFVALGTFFFALGVTFAYTIAFPAACDYLIGLGEGNFQPLINASEYFELVLFIMLGLGLVFQIPTVTYFLARLGLVTAGMLIKIWRYAVIVIFIAAAVISPTADIPNLMVFAMPMLTLYVISIGIAWFFHRRRKTQDEVDAMDDASTGG